MAGYGLLVCGQCAETHYRSNKPLSETDKLDPSMFEMVKEDALPPDQNSNMECVTCGNRLAFVFEGDFKAKTKLRSVPKPSEDVPPMNINVPGVEVLFSVRDGEEIKQVGQTTQGFVIITNKQILRIPA